MWKLVLTTLCFFLSLQEALADVISMDGEAPSEEVNKRNAHHVQRGLFFTIDLYWRWPDPNEILFYIDPYYSPKEQYWIRQSAAFIERDLLGCIRLRETDGRDRRPKIKVTPFLHNNRPEQYCKAFPGFRHSFAQKGRDQLFVVPRGPDSCLNETLVGLMKGWAITLGRLNEHQRWDRNEYIRLHPENIDFPEAYKRYDFLQAYLENFWMGLPYDTCSITHNRPTAFARPGSIAFSFRRGPQAVPDIPRLSQTDCQLISHMYGCNPRICRYWDCEAERWNTSWANTPKTTTRVTTTLSTARPSTSTTRLNSTTPTTTTRPTTTTARPTTTTAAIVTSTTRATVSGSTSKPSVSSTPAVTTTAQSTSTPSTSTTTATTSTTTSTAAPTTTTTVTTTTPAPQCTLQSFCQGNIDESSFLLGPYSPYQTYLLYSGNCIMEYTVNWTTNILNPIGDPELLTEYFPPPGGPTLVPPVNPVFLNRNQTNTTDGFDLNLINNNGASLLHCPTNGLFDTHAASCPTPSGPNSIAGTAGLTSISSMLNVGDFKTYHYVVDSSKKEIKLMDPNFQSTLQTTQGLLAGQKQIASITAIQILMDEVDIHPIVMGIVGTGDDGKTYAGVVNMPIVAHPNVPLSPIEWYNGTSALLSTRIEGC
ncbi:uncharacterized protein LOC129586658 [Paramacrobiotus metropolitanus]|uniref:uncharacterized protein LOC129586658 n=1 Tax=Paramacrobiotus metropolitanus TaxID=2943436 RepID=UPI002445A47E|nr:uncharacterized protein LOC129586658 [Paramacrobiotus metropolitanus]